MKSKWLHRQISGGLKFVLKLLSFPRLEKKLALRIEKKTRNFSEFYHFGGFFRFLSQKIPHANLGHSNPFPPNVDHRIFLIYNWIVLISNFTTHLWYYFLSHLILFIITIWASLVLDWRSRNYTGYHPRGGGAVPLAPTECGDQRIAHRFFELFFWRVFLKLVQINCSVCALSVLFWPSGWGKYFM